MYNSGLVVVIKSNGKILRENKDEAYLPFGSEYSILLKNLETRKCLIKITVDNQDVLDGNSLILNSNCEMELDGFMKGMVARNRFKFIRKTKEISEFRGDRIDDGIIRIEYWFEKFVEKRQVITENYNYNFTCNGNCFSCYKSYCMNRKYHWYNGSGTYSIGSSVGSSSFQNLSNVSSGSISGEPIGMYYSSLSNNTTFRNSGNLNAGINNLDKKSHDVKTVLDEGITVKGSEVHQQFQYGLIGDLEDNSRVIILKLIGMTGENKTVTNPVTIKTKKICQTCGKKSKSHMKFCSNCGTFLE